MFKRNTAPTSLLSVFALAAIVVLASVITAQINAPTNQAEPGSELLTVDESQDQRRPSTTHTSQDRDDPLYRKPVKGIDVIVQKDPGNTAVRTATTDQDGKVKFVGLAPGKYSLIIKPAIQALKQKTGGAADAADSGDYLITIAGASGALIERVWNAKLGMFAKGVAKDAESGRFASNVKSDSGNLRESAPVYEASIKFEVSTPSGGKPPEPLQATVVKSKSNITNN
jgi:hypothetical protein